MDNSERCSSAISAAGADGVNVAYRVKDTDIGDRTEERGYNLTFPALLKIQVQGVLELVDKMVLFASISTDRLTYLSASLRGTRLNNIIVYKLQSRIGMV